MRSAKCRRSLDCVERAYLERSPLAPHLPAYARLVGSVRLEDEPRYRAVVETMGFPG